MYAKAKQSIYYGLSIEYLQSALIILENQICYRISP